jgi:hypothetical protein
VSGPPPGDVAGNRAGREVDDVVHSRAGVDHGLVVVEDGGNVVAFRMPPLRITLDPKVE